MFEVKVDVSLNYANQSLLYKTKGWWDDGEEAYEKLCGSDNNINSANGTAK